jgi:hypothetical protein
MTGPGERPRGERPRGLRCTREFVAHQREWFASLQSRAAAGEPVAVVGVDAPHEILVAMGIPYVVAPWWSSLCGAKGRSAHYLGLLADLGYPQDEMQYVALGLASSFDPAAAPWGGLPRPSLFVTLGATGPEAKIMELWAEAVGGEVFTLDRTTDPVPASNWAGRIDREWPALLDSAALDLVESEIESLVDWLSERTGKTLDRSALLEVLELVNDQARTFADVRDLLISARPCPADIADTIPATNITQWHTGTAWACAAARQLLTELHERTREQSQPQERARLLWMGNPLWFDLGLYPRIRAKYGAATVWSMYIAIAADGYPRIDYGRPYRTLAARHLPHRDLLSMPPWNTSWVVREAVLAKVDGAVQVVSNSSPRGHRFIRESLEDAGIPVLDLDGDAVDPTVTGSGAIEAALGAFITSITEKQSGTHE